MTSAAEIGSIVQVHTRYRQAGGEDRVVEDERQMLEAAGIRVHQVLFDNATIPDQRSRFSDAKLALRALWSNEAARRVRAAVDQHQPGLVHVHNTFAVASPAVLAAAHRAGAPVVHTLHNYRLVCPVATVFRDGHPCTDCVGRSVPWPGIVHACVRDSVSQSAVAAATLVVHRARGTFRADVDAYIALTAFQRNILVAGGVPAKRIEVVPNFVEADDGRHEGSRTGALFVGRLAEEKGAKVLADAAAHEPGLLRVIGDGPLRDLIHASAQRGDLTALGPLASDAVATEIARTVALVVPSVWFEGLPLVVLEAYAAGTPVIASRLGSLAEIVEHEVTGLLSDPGDAVSLAKLVRWAVDHPAEMWAMGERARLRYEEKYATSAHLDALLLAYGRATSRHRQHG